MNCTTFRKYIGAFADGELDVPLNLEALEHLNVCPSCAGKVADVHGLKSALHRVHGEIAAPAALRAQVRGVVARLSAAASVGTAEGPTTGRRPSMDLVSVLRRWFLPLSVTTMVLLGAFYLLRTGPLSATVPPGAMGPAARFVADVRERHDLCVTRPPLFDRNVFPYPGVGTRLVADQLSRRLSRRALVPDLSRAGFALVGADLCRIGGRSAGQAFYRREPAGTALSLFSAEPVPELTPNRPASTFGVPYFASSVEGEPTVVAWHAPEGTFGACGDLAESELVKTLAPFRTAQLGFPSGALLASAHHSEAP